MDTSQLRLSSTRIGPLPIVNHFVDHLRIDALLDRFVPTADRRVKLTYAKALGVLLRSVLVEREPIYSQHETVAAFSPKGFGIEQYELEHLGDDRIGPTLARNLQSLHLIILIPILFFSAPAAGAGRKKEGPEGPSNGSKMN